MASGSYEQIFLALAVRNKLVSTEAAQACLKEFASQPAEDMHGIDEIVMSRGLVTEEQSAALASAARKLTAATKTEKVSGSQTTTTRRVLAAAVNPKEPVPGYQIVAKLGTGGTSTVFLAQETKPPGRKVALKILHPSKAADPKAQLRFQIESALLVKLDHPNLVKGFAHGKHGPLVFLAMEFLEGETALEALDRDGAFTESRAVGIALETAEVLSYLQGQGFVHCDIKPGNIMLLKDGRSKLLDLGFAKPVGKAGAAASETTSGTVQYMSPEQARGQADLDARADIYSLGATLWHMVMGQVPFTGGDSLEVMAKQVMEQLNSSEIKNRRFSKHLHYFIERMMTKDKALRYQTPRELIDDIQSQMEGFSSLEYKPDERPTTTRILQGLRGAGGGPVDGGGNSTRRLRPPPPRR